MLPNQSVEYKQPNPSPVPKVAAAGIGGAVTSVLLWVAKSVWDIDPPAEVGAAIATIVAFLAGYFKKDVKPAQAVRIIKDEGSTPYGT